MIWKNNNELPNRLLNYMYVLTKIGAPVAQWVKRWPTDLADRDRSSFEGKSSQS